MVAIQSGSLKNLWTCKGMSALSIPVTTHQPLPWHTCPSGCTIKLWLLRTAHADVNQQISCHVRCPVSPYMAYCGSTGPAAIRVHLSRMRWLASGAAAAAAMVAFKMMRTQPPVDSTDEFQQIGSHGLYRFQRVHHFLPWTWQVSLKYCATQPASSPSPVNLPVPVRRLK